MCDSKELIVEYLYDDMDRGDRAAFERHLQACADCQGEVSALAGTRTLIAAWAPPEPELGFEMIRRQAPPAPVAAPSWRALPGWALAAAAALVLAASAAIANIEVRYGSDGVTVRTGWARAAETAGAGGASNVQTVSAPAPASTSDDDFAVIHKRLNQLELALAQAPAAQPVPAGGVSDAELLRRVRLVVSEAETRQQREFALQMAQMFRDFDRQRRTDLAAIQEGLQGYQGLTNAELAKNRDMVNQLFRVSSRQER